MPGLATSLTNMQPRTAKPKATPYKLTDGGGLYLRIKPDGAKYWRMGYRVAGAERGLAFGKYPEVSLAYDVIDNVRFGRTAVRGPSTVALLGIGLPGLAASRRKEAKK